MLTYTRHKEHYILPAVFLGLLIAHLVLIWTTSILPFIDLPDHLATATIVRHYGEPDNRYSEFYSVGSFYLRPNVAHILFCSSSLFPTVEYANKVYYTLYIILLPLSILLIIRFLGGKLYYSLLSFLLIYNLNVCWGFSGYTLSIPIFLLTFLVMIAILRNRRNVLVISLGVLFILIFLIHALMAVFTISTFFVLILARRQNLLKTLLTALLTTLPVIAIIVIWWSQREISSAAGPGFISSLIHYYGADYIASLPGRARLIVFDNYFLFPGAWGYLAAALFFGIILAPSIPFLCKPIKTYQALSEWNANSTAPVLVLLFWSLVCFVVLPEEIFNFQILYPRFSVIFLAAAIILGSLVGSSRIIKWLFVAFCTASALHLMLWAHYFRDFNAQNAQFNRAFFPHDAHRKVLAGVVYSLYFRGKPIYIHFPSYYIVWTKGIGTFRIVDLIDFAPPVRRKDNGPIVPMYSEWAWLTGNFHPSYLHADYLLIRGKAGKDFSAYKLSFQELRSADKWTLYKRHFNKTTSPGSVQ